MQQTTPEGACLMWSTIIGLFSMVLHNSREENSQIRHQKEKEENTHYSFSGRELTLAMLNEWWSATLEDLHTFGVQLPPVADFSFAQVVFG
jgi:hypothetical protein